MVVGMGIDLVEIERFRKLKNKEEFLNQFLTEKEITNTPKVNKDFFYAKTFAIKEAVLKALGCGLEYGSYWHNIEINKDSEASLSGVLGKLAEEKSVTKINITGACSKKYAVGAVLLEGRLK